MKIAYIVKDKVFSVFETDKMPDWPIFPGSDKKPILIDVTGQTVDVGDLYSPTSRKITPAMKTKKR